MDRIFIKGLELQGVIGVYEHEKGVKQPILVDLELFVDTTSAARSGLIKDTVDYDLVAQRVAQLVEQGQSELLETLAQHIADVILKEFKVPKLRCTINKPQAINNAQMVGITIERES